MTTDIQSITDMWEPSLNPVTKKHVVKNLLFIEAYALECKVPIPYDDYFNPNLEWELVLDFPKFSGEAEMFSFDLGYSEDYMRMLQYVTIGKIIFGYPELLKYMNVEKLSGGRAKNEPL